jgi:phosphatidylethanolamine/phosphatidyl-N-methylethanolamine N-methyltransferase
MAQRASLSVAKKHRLNDEMRFIRTWLEKPLETGAVAPSGKVLARAMARYVNPEITGPIIELGPGTGPVTEALVARGVDPARLVLVEFNPMFCRLLRTRYPAATIVQGDAYGLKRSLGKVIPPHTAAAVVSSLPIVTKPARTRVRLVNEALGFLSSGAPFIQFTYAVGPPLQRALSGVMAEASERIWLNLPPARVWIYRRPAFPGRLGRCGT